MAQVIESNDIFGKIGRGFGQGLGEQIPKEVAHKRLSEGLQKLGQEKNLSPREFLTKAYSTYGVTPQMAQSFGELASREQQGRAMQDLNNPPQQPSPFSNIQPRQQQQQGSEIPSITKASNLEKIQEGYIPPTKDEIFRAAGEEYNANPAKFGHDPQKAIDYAEDAAAKDEKRNQAYLKQHGILSDVQQNIRQKHCLPKHICFRKNLQQQNLYSNQLSTVPIFT